MRQLYIERNFSQESLQLVTTMNAIVTDYVAQGYRLTVRQLYYQLVARAVIENTERSYKRVTGIVNDAKLAGLMDWEAIEDRTREFVSRSHWTSPSEILRASAQSYHMDMWEDQPQKVFCIVEKEALAGVLTRVCHRYDVPLLAARGYPSGTVLREFCVGDVMNALQNGQDVTVLHLGDHDPSGIDMTRDLRERISMFAEDRIDVVRIALTTKQIEDQTPPPNPAKTTDSRFADYRKVYGDDSWELDALRPDFITGLVGMHINDRIDQDRWKAREDMIADIRARITKVADTFDASL